MAESNGDSDQPRVRVVIIEDESLFRELLSIALKQFPEIELVGSFGDSESALRAVPLLRPNVALMDIDLSDSMNGIQLGLNLRQKLPELGIVLLSNHGDPEFVSSLPSEVLAGWSYLLKKSANDVQTLRRAIEGAAGRLVVLDPQLVAALRPRAGGLLSGLSVRQRQILELIAQGFSNATIAEQLIMAEKSVENQINSLYQNLGIESKQASVHPRVKAVLAYMRESGKIGTV